MHVIGCIVGLVFSLAKENSGSFMGQEFVDKRSGAVWCEEEITPRKFNKLPEETFNKITEGAADFTVAIKWRAPKRIHASIHTLTMSNHTIEALCKESADPEIREQELRVRFDIFTMQNPHTCLIPEAIAAPSNALLAVQKLIPHRERNNDPINPRTVTSDFLITESAKLLPGRR